MGCGLRSTLSGWLPGALEWEGSSFDGLWLHLFFGYGSSHTRLCNRHLRVACEKEALQNVGAIFDAVDVRSAGFGQGRRLAYKHFATYACD